MNCVGLCSAVIPNMSLARHSGMTALRHPGDDKRLCPRSGNPPGGTREGGAGRQRCAPVWPATYIRWWVHEAPCSAHCGPVRRLAAMSTSRPGLSPSASLQSGPLSALGRSIHQPVETFGSRPPAPVLRCGSAEAHLMPEAGEAHHNMRPASHSVGIHYEAANLSPVPQSVPGPATAALAVRGDVSPRVSIGRRPTLLDHGHLEIADALDVALELVALLDGADAGRRAGEDQVARL